MAGRRARRSGREKGISTVEVVILTPVLFLFTLTMVGLALFAQNVSQVQDAASDAARMAALQSPGLARTNQAKTTAAEDLDHTCVPEVKFPSAPNLTGRDANVTVLETTVVCTVDVFGVTHTITESAYAPVDVYGGEHQ